MVKNQNDTIHLPVMVDEIASFLITDIDGAYLDLTAGGGGHLKKLANHLSERSRLYGIDRDPEAVKRVEEALADLPQFRKIALGSFGNLTELVSQFEEKLFAGMLLDLGLSSYQLDSPVRGFTYRYDGPLDMRFDASVGIPAWQLIENSTKSELLQIFREYGEEKQATKLASHIYREREKVEIRTTFQLRDIISQIVPERFVTKTLARIFQSLRIAVNDELQQIQNLMPEMLNLLQSGGRIAVLSYHSLEDRIIKRFFQVQSKGECTCPKDLPVCICGAAASLKIITPKPVSPSVEEIEHNSRARSARLRVAEKL